MLRPKWRSEACTPTRALCTSDAECLTVGRNSGETYPAAGQTSSGNALRVADSSILKIRIDDPTKVLGQKTKDGRTPHLLLGVWGGNGLFVPAHKTSSDSAGAQYQLSIPRDTALKLQLSSRDLKLADSNGAAVSALSGDQQPFQHNSGDPNPKSFKYTITGLVP